MENTSELVIVLTEESAIIEEEEDSGLPWQYEGYYALFKYVALVLWAGGTLGNIMTLAVLHSKRYGYSPANVALSALAIADIGCLNCGCLRNWLRMLVGIDVRTFNIAGCRIHIFLTYMFGQLSPWILAFITIERCLSVVFPLKLKNIVSGRRIIAAILCLTTFLCAINIPFLLYSHIDESGVCTMMLQYKPVILYIYIYWSDVMLAILLPLFVISCGNIVIITKLAQAKRKKEEMAGKGGPESRTVTIMLVSVGIAFLVTMFPSAIYWLGHSTHIWPRGTAQQEYNLSFIYGFMMVLIYVNNSINFLLYCLTGSRFRKAFLDIVCCRKAEVTRAPSTSKTGVTNLSVKIT